MSSLAQLKNSTLDSLGFDAYNERPIIPAAIDINLVETGSLFPDTSIPPSKLTVPLYSTITTDTGVATRTFADGTGLQVISHNLGLVPKIVRITGTRIPTGSTQMSIGVGVSTSNTTYINLATDVTGGGGKYTSSSTGTIILFNNPGGTNEGEAVLSDITSTTFTLNWTTGIAGTGSASFIWEVIA